MTTNINAIANARANSRLKRSFIFNVWLIITVIYTVSRSIITRVISAGTSIYIR